MTSATDHPERDLLGGPINAGVLRSSRLWNHWLGGKDTYAIDREVGDLIQELVPGIVDTARHSRAFLARAACCVAVAGVSQFLDISALVVRTPARSLTLCHPGLTARIEADLRKPEVILQAACRTLELSKPVGALPLDVMEHLPDHQAVPAVRRRPIALAPGSHLVIAHRPPTPGSAQYKALQQISGHGGAP